MRFFFILTIDMALIGTRSLLILTLGSRVGTSGERETPGHDIMYVSTGSDARPALTSVELGNIPNKGHRWADVALIQLLAGAAGGANPVHISGLALAFFFLFCSNVFRFSSLRSTIAFLPGLPFAF